MKNLLLIMMVSLGHIIFTAQFPIELSDLAKPALYPNDKTNQTDGCVTRITQDKKNKPKVVKVLASQTKY